MSKASPNFERLVADCYDDVYRFALSLTHTEAEAVDLTQQTFLKFARKGGEIKNSSKTKSWLFSVLRNEFTDIKRKTTRFPTEEITPTIQDENPSADAKADGQMALAALRKIPLTFREPLALYYLQGYTYPEISNILSIPVGTVMSRLHRGKSLLRELLNPNSNTHG